MRATNLVLKNEAHTGICVVYAPSQEMPAIHSHTGYPHFSHSKDAIKVKNRPTTARHWQGYRTALLLLVLLGCVWCKLQEDIRCPAISLSALFL